MVQKEDFTGFYEGLSQKDLTLLRGFLQHQLSELEMLLSGNGAHHKDGQGATVEQDAARKQENSIERIPLLARSINSHNNPAYIDRKDAERTLQRELKEERLVKRALDIVLIARPDGSKQVPERSLRRLIKEIEGYSLLSLEQVGNALGITTSPEVTKVLSSYPSFEVKDIVVKANPYRRTGMNMFMIKEGVTLDAVVGRLRRVQESLKKGQASYSDICRYLAGRKKLPPQNCYFDMVVESAFLLTPDGTYDGSAFEKRRKSWEGFRFLALETSFPTGEVAKIYLALYNGKATDLTTTLDISGTSTYDPSEHPDKLFLFRYNPNSKEREVNFQELGKALGFSLRTQS